MRFASHQGLWDLSCWERFRSRRVVDHPVVLEETKGRVQPLPTPPLPTEALALLVPHHVSPHLVLDPVLNESEDPTRIPHAEVVHPAFQNRIDDADNPIHRLGNLA